MINYPDGRKAVEVKKNNRIDHRRKENKTEAQKVRESYIKSNMGMDFESDVSKSCEFFRQKGLADIYKRPTPIKVVKMSKTHPGQIEEAYFEEKSTTDYVGIYKGRYIDFECKETIHDTIPFKMIREQQFLHLESITKLGGIGFFLVSFKRAEEVYLIDCRYLLEEIKEKKHPGFKREFFQEHGVPVQRTYLPPYQILAAIDKVFQL